MNKKDVQLLKLWLDSEISIMHMQWAILLGAVAHNQWIWTVVAAYTVLTLGYTGRRTSAIARVDPNYLKVPKDIK